MINFELKHKDDTKPAGTSPDLRMSWFWLTDGDLWLKLSDSVLYEYTPEALEYFGNKTSIYNDYPIVRFIEDFTELFNLISESVPDNMYLLTENLTKFLNDAQKWLDIYDTDVNEHCDFYFEEYDKLISWTYTRSFDSGHLIGGPQISFFRNKDKIRIIWNTEFKIENGIELWTAKNGSIELSYIDFISKIKDFGARFFNQMNKQVELAVKKDWKEVQIDKKKTDRRT